MHAVIHNMRWRGVYDNSCNQNDVDTSRTSVSIPKNTHLLHTGGVVKKQRLRSFCE